MIAKSKPTLFNFASNSFITSSQMKADKIPFWEKTFVGEIVIEVPVGVEVITLNLWWEYNGVELPKGDPMING